MQAKVPNARFLLRRIVRDDVKAVLARYDDLPIEWLEAMPQPELANQLRQADLFILPSLEDGLAFTVLEALASGLPVVTASSRRCAGCGRSEGCASPIAGCARASCTG